MGGIEFLIVLTQPVMNVCILQDAPQKKNRPLL